MQICNKSASKIQTTQQRFITFATYEQFWCYSCGNQIKENLKRKERKENKKKQHCNEMKSPTLEMLLKVNPHNNSKKKE